MGNKPRVESKYGLHHVVTRGTGRMILFEEEEDYERYLQAARRFSASLDLEIYAYCLMDNHVHLVIRANLPVLTSFMRRLDTWHARWFNEKYDHVGHVYQNSFKSVPIDSEEQLLACIRYVFQNPVAAGLVDSCGDYKWSSYRECEGELVLRDGLVSAVESIMGLFSSSRDFERFNLQEEKPEGHLECEWERVSGDERARAIIQGALGEGVSKWLQAVPRAERDRCVGELRGRGVSVRQVERICGVSRGVVQRIWERGRSGS